MPYFDQKVELGFIQVSSLSEKKLMFWPRRLSVVFRHLLCPGTYPACWRQATAAIIQELLLLL